MCGLCAWFVCALGLDWVWLLVGVDREFWRQTANPVVRKEFPKYEPKLVLDEGFVAPSVQVMFGA